MCSNAHSITSNLLDIPCIYIQKVCKSKEKPSQPLKNPDWNNHNTFTSPEENISDFRGFTNISTYIVYSHSININHR